MERWIILHRTNYFLFVFFRGQTIISPPAAPFEFPAKMSTAVERQLQLVRGTDTGAGDYSDVVGGFSEGVPGASLKAPEPLCGQQGSACGVTFAVEPLTPRLWVPRCCQRSRSSEILMSC